MFLGYVTSLAVNEHYVRESTPYISLKGSGRPQSYETYGSGQKEVSSCEHAKHSLFLYCYLFINYYMHSYY